MNRAVICEDGIAKRISLDHKATDISERDRIQSIGGFVTEKGRVMGDLAVARSIGDSTCTPYVTHKPNINELTLSENAEFIILACDGLFDVMSDQEACDLVRRYPREKSSQILRDFAYLLLSGDNISVIVIHLKLAEDRKMERPLSWSGKSKILPLSDSLIPSRTSIDDTDAQRESVFVRRVTSESVRKKTSLVGSYPKELPSKSSNIIIVESVQSESHSLDLQLKKEEEEENEDEEEVVVVEEESSTLIITETLTDQNDDANSNFEGGEKEVEEAEEIRKELEKLAEDILLLNINGDGEA